MGGGLSTAKFNKEQPNVIIKEKSVMVIRLVVLVFSLRSGHMRPLLTVNYPYILFW